MNLLGNMPIDTSPDLGLRLVDLLVLALPIFAALMLAEVLVTSLQTVRPLWVKPPAGSRYQTQDQPDGYQCGGDSFRCRKTASTVRHNHIPAVQLTEPRTYALRSLYEL